MLVDGYSDCKRLRQSLELEARKVKVSVAQSCQTLQPSGLQSTGSSVHGILQARILEWVVIPKNLGKTKTIPKNLGKTKNLGIKSPVLR